MSMLTRQADALVCGSSNSTSTASLISGQSVTLCVHLLPQRVKVAFDVQVDKFTALTTRHIYDALTADTDLVFQLSTNTTFGGQSAYVRPAAQRVYPVFNLLLTLSEGNITQIEVENASAACTNAATETLLNSDPAATAAKGSPNCPVALCGTAEKAVGKCDFKVLVAWIGTDRKGTELISAAQRLINYQHYNLPALFNQVVAINNNLDPANPEAYETKLIPPAVASRLGVAR